MSKLRKHIALFLTIILLTTMTGNVLADGKDSEYSKKAKILCLVDDPNLFHEDLVVEKANSSIYLSTSSSELTQYDMLIISYSQIDDISRQLKTKQLIDNGMTLYVKDADIKGNELARKLNIPYIGEDYAKGGEKLGIAVCRINNEYCFINMFGLSAISVTESKTISTSNNKSNEIDNTIGESCRDIGLSDANINRIISYKSEIYSDISKLQGIQIDDKSLSLQTIPSGYDYPSYNSISLYYDDPIAGRYTVGAYLVTQYVYLQGTKVINGKIHEVYNTVGALRVGAEPYYNVKTFKARLHCNITQHDKFDETYISSNYSVSQGLSVDANKDGVGASGSLNWTTSPDSMSVQNYIPAADYCDWTCTPTSVIRGHTFRIEPGISAINNNATDYKTGAFSGFRSAKISYVGGGGAYREYSYGAFEVGKWW